MSHLHGPWLFALVLIAAVIGRAAENAAPPAGGRVGDYEITVTGVERTDLWEMMPGNQLMPKIKATPGNEILVVAFEVRNSKTGADDTTKAFEDFSIETTDGQIVKSSIVSTNMRKIPFGVPTGTEVRRFIIEGASIPLEKK
jgi:hypothetical protein